MTASGDEDVALKLLHTADWHLGRRFPSFDEADRLPLMRARLDAVRRILDLAEQYTVDAVLVAGDVFDDPSPDAQWWQGLCTCLEGREWNERPLILLPGNHDPLTAKSIWAEDSPLRAAVPEWAHVVERPNQEFVLGENAVLYASPCTSQAGSADLAMRLPAREPGDERIRVGMVHGRTFEAEGYQTNFPISPEAASERGFDYLALGDLHAWKIVRGTPPTVYPGSPEPTAFGEPDSGDCAVVFFRRRNRVATIRPVRVGRWTWRQEIVRDLAALRGLRDGRDLSQTVLRLTVDMKVPLAEYEEARRLLAELKGTEAARGRVGVLREDVTGLVIDATGSETHFDDLPAPLQAAAAKLKAQADGEEGELARRALWNLYRLVREGGA